MRRTSLPLLLAGLTLGASSGPNVANASTAETHRATCDELKGQTWQRNDTWRVFGTEADTFNSYLSACRRSGRPATRLLRLGAWASAPRLSGDLLQVENEGRYDNCSGYVADLAAQRFTLTHACDTPFRNDVLLPSGALVRLSAVSTPQPNGVSQSVSELAVDDATGTTTVAAGASSVVPLPGSPAAAEGFYYTASDGSLRRVATAGRARTDGWRPFRGEDNAFRDARTVRTRARVPTVPRRTTTYLGAYEVRHDRAKRGRKASLTVRYPRPETKGSDLIARLAPGSADELRVLGGVLVGRFADDAAAVRLWVPSASKPGKPLLTLPYPTDPAAAPIDVGGALAFPTPTGVALLQGRYYETPPAVVPVTLPRGARDLARSPAPGSVGDRQRLLFTDASGQAASVEYVLPSS